MGLAEEIGISECIEFHIYKLTKGLSQSVTFSLVIMVFLSLSPAATEKVFNFDLHFLGLESYSFICVAKLFLFLSVIWDIHNVMVKVLLYNGMTWVGKVKEPWWKKLTHIFFHMKLQENFQVMPNELCLICYELRVNVE